MADKPATVTNIPVGVTKNSAVAKAYYVWKGLNTPGADPKKRNEAMKDFIESLGNGGQDGLTYDNLKKVYEQNKMLVEMPDGNYDKVVFPSSANDLLKNIVNNKLEIDNAPALMDARVKEAKGKASEAQFRGKNEELTYGYLKSRVGPKGDKVGGGDGDAGFNRLLNGVINDAGPRH